MRLLIYILILSTISMAGVIRVAVSANVSYAIDSLKEEFNKKYPDTKVDITIGSSGKLTAQIKNNAPYNIFISANMLYPETLYREKIAITKPIIYAKGKLAYFSRKKRDFSNPIALLENSEIKKIAVANPKTAPYGVASFEAFKNANILDKIKEKFIYGESISQTMTYSLMVADIGVIAKSLLYSPKMAKFRENINWVEVNPKLYTPISQGIVLLKSGEKNQEAKAFYHFMLSREAKRILEDFGYKTI